ncbi:MAG: hypothetical protein LBT47_09255 [Deltaproteobacteria bacterium]|jgi:hypothetical protein|nr:hypothetical protein [Deltaproteobacteria bacterium]
MNPVTNRPNDSFRPLQVAATIRQTTVAAIEPTPNVVSAIVKVGHSKPHATISNTMVARVDSYTSPPGRNMAHYLTMDVDKAGSENTTIADALQRYLNVSPTRKLGGDAKALESLDSYPTLVMDEDQAWAEPLSYQFSVNGVVQRQSQPTFYARGGSLRLRVIGRGVTTVATPATTGTEPLPVGPMPAGAYYPTATAAQLAMRRLSDMFDSNGGFKPISVGPELNQEPGQSLADTSKTQEPAVVSGPKISEYVKDGLNRFANFGIYNAAPRLHLSALSNQAA